MASVLIYRGSRRPRVRGRLNVSIILEALRKSERERQAGQVPGMAEVIQSNTDRRNRWLPWFLGAVVVINLCGLGYWFYRDHRNPSAPEAVPMVAGQGNARDFPSPSSTLVPEVPMDTASSRDGHPPPQQPAYESLPPPVYPMPQHLLPPANPGALRQDEYDPVDAELEAENGVASLENVQTSPHKSGLPRIDELPENIRDRMPPLKITMFAYSENPQERFIIVNMKKYVAGEVLPGGLLLIEIRAEDMVAEIDGQKFLIPRF